jgi:hypothetical protein
MLLVMKQVRTTSTRIIKNSYHINCTIFHKNQKYTLLSDGGMVALVAPGVANSGVIQANGIAQRNGEIILTGGQQGIVKIAGKLSAKKVKATGEKVGAFDAAKITASEVLIDGMYSYVAPDVIIDASAYLNGNGGFVEVSGKENLDFNGFVDMRAPNGLWGTLLLDPKFLIVATSGGPYNGNNAFANNPSGTNTITPASIDAIAGNVILQANTDITFTDALHMTTSGATLTVQAGRSILINNNIITTNGAIAMTANDSAATVAQRDAGAGNISMASSTSLLAGNQNITLTIGSANTGGFTSGSMTLDGAVINTSGVLSLTSPNDISLTNGTLLIGTSGITATATHNMTFTGGSVIFNAPDINNN